MTHRIGLLLIVLLALASKAAADQIVLKNGDRLTGTIVLEHNGLQELNLRWVLGGGIGYHAIKSERTKLDLLAGLDMSREFFEGNDNDRTSLEAQLGQTLDHRLTPRLHLTEQLFFFPNLSEGGEYRINFDAGLVADVTRRIGWQVTLSDRYLSNPPGGFKQNDLLLTTGLKVKLGAIR